MPSGIGILFAGATLMAFTSVGIAAPSATEPPGAVASPAAMAAVAGRSAADRTATRATRLEVWSHPARISRLRPGQSRGIAVSAVETMAEWRDVTADVHASTTAGKITPRRAQTRKGHPARFRLTRTSGAYGFVTFTATTRKYGAANKVVPWGKVALPQTLSGTLTFDQHIGGTGTVLPYSHQRSEWSVTYRLESRNWRGMALYSLTGGNWISEWAPDTPTETQECLGQGTGPADKGSIRYDWRGSGALRGGAGSYLIDAGSTVSYIVECAYHLIEEYPAFSFGYDPEVGGIHPEHFQGARTVEHPDEEVLRWWWDLKAS